VGSVEIFATEDTQTQRKNEADFNSDRKRKTAPLGTKGVANGRQEQPHLSRGKLQDWTGIQASSAFKK
jgi:hypothetical protein